MIYAFWSKDDGSTTSILKENMKDVVYEDSSLAFLKQWCLQYGANFEGRRIASSYILQVKQKVPILISDKTLDLVFPTKSPYKKDCVWINYRAVSTCRHIPKGVIIEFRDGYKLELEEDIRTIRRELHLCKIYIEHLSNVAFMEQRII